MDSRWWFCKVDNEGNYSIQIENKGQNEKRRALRPARGKNVVNNLLHAQKRRNDMWGSRLKLLNISVRWKSTILITITIHIRPLEHCLRQTQRYNPSQRRVCISIWSSRWKISLFTYFWWGSPFWHIGCIEEHDWLCIMEGAVQGNTLCNFAWISTCIPQCICIGHQANAIGRWPWMQCRLACEYVLYSSYPILFADIIRLIFKCYHYDRNI